MAQLLLFWWLLKKDFMKKYNKILVAVELDTKEDQPLLSRALEIAKDHDAKVFLLHVLEHLGSYGAAYGVAAGANIEDLLSEKAKKSLVTFARAHHLDESQCLITRGDSAHMILSEAKGIDADLIIIGSHGRHGLALLIGSTADGVVHAAQCDVLAVKL